MPLKWESKMLFDIDVFLLGVEKSKFANERLWLISDKISKYKARRRYYRVGIPLMIRCG